MKKCFFIPACVMTLLAIAFVIASCTHMLSLPFDHDTSSALMGLYAVVTTLLYMLAFWKKDSSRIYIPIAVFELGAVYFLVQSITWVAAEGRNNMNLCIALGLNLLASLLAALQRKRDEKKQLVI